LFYPGGDLSKKKNTVLEYIAALEGVNDRLVTTLRFCIKLLTKFKSQVPDPEGWQDMLNTFELTLHTAETACEPKTFH
jgi:hypothetical protein